MLPFRIRSHPDFIGRPTYTIELTQSRTCLTFPTLIISPTPFNKKCVRSHNHEIAGDTPQGGLCIKPDAFFAAQFAAQFASPSTRRSDPQGDAPFASFFKVSRSLAVRFNRRGVCAKKKTQTLKNQNAQSVPA